MQPFLSSPHRPTAILSIFSKTLTRIRPLSSTMSISFKPHAFAGNPIRSQTPKSDGPLSPSSAYESLKNQLLHQTGSLKSPIFKILPFNKGRPLATSTGEDDAVPNWHLGWINLDDCDAFMKPLMVDWIDLLVYLGSRSEEDEVYWAIDVSEQSGLDSEWSGRQLCFVELRTLMVATDWANLLAMGELAIAGHARALLEWHNTTRFCGHCGWKAVPMEAGRRKQCSNDLCKKRIYPRVDPVVIMLVIDRENDRALLSRQSRFVPRMWSCLAGFIEPGESLEEAVRRETFEETGIEVGEVIYHSSQPWPVGPSSMPCQLMVGFFAFAKSLEISVDKSELEDAQWHSREDVKKAITIAEYEKAQKTAAEKVDQICRGVEKAQNVESGELAPMFIPGPFAIAHHLISTWAHGSPLTSAEAQVKQLSSSLSNL